jgi:succinate dehydrogenase / fumarate reductase, cytochrome b subunit
MKKNPVFLNLSKIYFPITAIVSILHRVSGVIIFLFIPLCLWAMDYSLISDYAFQELHELFGSLSIKLLAYLGLVAFIFHLLAGMRHLLMDMHWGESLSCAKRSAVVVFLLTFFIIALIGLSWWLK